MISSSELILNSDQSVYHLGLRSGEIPQHIITVGDPDRVDMLKSYFDYIHFDKQIREFRSMLAEIGGREILVISTGIGTDNIDIVFTEIDACVNIDLNTRTVKDNLTSLNFFRIGTSGALRPDIPIGSCLASSHAIGLDGLMAFYDREVDANTQQLAEQMHAYVRQHFPWMHCYLAAGAADLVDAFVDKGFYKGITVTAAGFYGPQGRNIRVPLKDHNFLSKLTSMPLGTHQITNLEMETAGIYGMAQALGHKAVSLNAILANRFDGSFADNPSKVVENLIEKCLEVIITNQNI